MAKQSKKAKDGRANNTAPFKDIDWETVDKLCAIHCTKAEIIDFLGIDTKTLSRACKREKRIEWAAYYESKRSPGKISLRRKQYEIAMTGDKTMLIWLGKQWLGQAEKQQLEMSVTEMSDEQLMAEFHKIRDKIDGVPDED